MDTKKKKEPGDLPPLKKSDSLLAEHLKGLNGNPNVMTVSLLVSTLVEELCSFYEHDERRDILFRVVCDQLVEMSLLSPLAYIDELAAVRARYRETFMQILKMGQVIASEQANKMKALGMPLSKSPGNGFALRSISSALNHHGQGPDHFVLMPSRYQEEFEELNLIGHGGFGRVYRARNRVDGQEYAVKKIRLPKKSSRENILKIFREVKVLAGLHHKHVVGYNAAWLEMEAENDSMPSKAGTPNQSHSDLEISAQHAQLDSPASKLNGHNRRPAPNPIDIRRGPIMNITEDSAEEDGIVFARGDSEPDLAPLVVSGDSAMVPPSAPDEKKRLRMVDNTDFSTLQSHLPTFKFQAATLSQTPVTLFIQMELCGKTLRDWLRERNSPNGMGEMDDDTAKDSAVLVDVIECNKILKHILKGIDYIHSKGLIHRDLKPRNIFFHTCDNRVMIGDFGLARKDLLTSNDDAFFSPVPSLGSLGRRLSAGVGTVTYASPEQLHGSAYDIKSDMFSLGIVMFEILSVFATEMERAIALSAIRSGRLPPEFVINYPAHAKVIQSLLRTDARTRPEAREILTSDLFLNRDLIIQNLQQQVNQLQAALAEKNLPGNSE
ncbi:eukaryotic translation initiation factor 2-alpha kinase-like [Paramacrobiotus metropolitanus]|uniref:eukaryotic translation initiation factor 2-alpha kinase-like n=1 Tax=Paramacrobiotus metropolitanus TaxID=2943436 RepID=UPI0024461B30|nr:eukaryotic translation initiation factor 2-alpha kinase-like [Paramacrobiotus metropolitanus]